MILRLLQTPLQQAFFLLELKIAQIQRQSGQLVLDAASGTEAAV